jgi:hypothetical protein
MTAPVSRRGQIGNAPDKACNGQDMAGGYHILEMFIPSFPSAKTVRSVASVRTGWIT